VKVDQVLARLIPDEESPAVSEAQPASEQAEIKD
jgi:hypothetical protein